MHGNAKTPEDLRAAFDYGAGRIVVDSVSEIVRLTALSPPHQRVPLSSWAAADAIERVLAHPELELAGLHCHLGSQLTELTAFETAARRLIGLMAATRDRTGVVLTELNLGGGHAVPYVDGDEGFDLAGFADRMRRVLATECASFRLPVPRLVVEPGRAIVNRAMVTLHRVLAIKHVTGVRTFVAVDGGHERQPPAGAVRGEVLRARGAPVACAGGAGDRGGAALRGRGRARGGRAAAGRYPAR